MTDQREQDGTEQYRRSIDAISEPMTRQQEAAEFKRLRAGDESARDRIVHANLRFAMKIAREYEGKGLPLDDLVAEANCGIMEAIDRFDENRGFKFISYAVWWVRQKIKFALKRDVHDVHRPLSAISIHRKAAAAAVSLSHIEGRAVSLEEAADALGFSDRAVDAVVAWSGEVSLDAPLRDSDRMALADRLESAEYIATGNSAEISLVLDKLDARTRKVVVQYYGLNGEVPMTLEDVGAGLGVTLERARQIKEQGLRVMRGNGLLK